MKSLYVFDYAEATTVIRCACGWMGEWIGDKKPFGRHVMVTHLGRTTAFTIVTEKAGRLGRWNSEVGGLVP